MGELYGVSELTDMLDRNNFKLYRILDEQKGKTERLVLVKNLGVKLNSEKIKITLTFSRYGLKRNLIICIVFNFDLFLRNIFVYFTVK